MPTPTRPLPELLVVRSWHDSMLAQYGRGFDPTSAYVELFWLPVVGPTAAWCYRRLSLMTLASPENRAAIPALELARQLGLGHISSPTRHTPLARAVSRLVHYGLTRWDGDELEVRMLTPTLTYRQLQTLTPHLVEMHRTILDEADDEEDEAGESELGGDAA